jgi:hypothetical protein
VRSTPEPTRRSQGQITPIGWIYVVFGAGAVIMCISGVEIGHDHLRIYDAWLPALLIIAGIGAVLRRPWGRWLCYAFSVLFLPATPLGTIVGGLMIYHLTVHRDQFRRVGPTSPPITP